MNINFQSLYAPIQRFFPLVLTAQQQKYLMIVSTALGCLATLYLAKRYCFKNQCCQIHSPFFDFFKKNNTPEANTLETPPVEKVSLETPLIEKIFLEIPLSPLFKAPLFQDTGETTESFSPLLTIPSPFENIYESRPTSENFSISEIKMTPLTTISPLTDTKTDESLKKVTFFSKNEGKSSDESVQE